MIFELIHGKEQNAKKIAVQHKGASSKVVYVVSKQRT